MCNLFTARLAEVYCDQKKYYKKSLRFWNQIFGFSLGVAIVFSIVYFYCSYTDSFTYLNLLKFLPVWVFSGFVLYYSTKQISEYKRLWSEYGYKEALSRTCVEYEKVINESKNQELKEKLLEIMIKVVKSNPSVTEDVDIFKDALSFATQKSEK